MSFGDWIHRPMQIARPLPPGFQPARRGAKQALLINPFYPKDRHASYGKHVLTPTLALTSVAASTPSDWTVRVWDENLLLGELPLDPFPSVVGITVHLTFARRAYELSRWFRERGAQVVLGGLHATSCPAGVSPHADAIAIGEGTQLWPQILRDAEKNQLSPVNSSRSTPSATKSSATRIPTVSLSTTTSDPVPTTCESCVEPWRHCRSSGALRCRST